MRRELISEAALRDKVAASGIFLAKKSTEELVQVEDHEHEQAPATKGAGPVVAEAHAHVQGGLLGEKSEHAFALMSGALLAIGWVTAWKALGPVWMPIACYAAAYAFGGFFSLCEAIENLRARRFEIDTLMLVAAAGAAALGQWAEGALVLFLFSLGHSLEHYTMGRARRAIEALAKLAPERATVRRQGTVVEVTVAELIIGDVVIVRPNERLPADGLVIPGATSVNQAPVTGESVPVDKRALDNPTTALAQFDRIGPEHRVFAGTINGAGAIEILVARPADQLTIARLVRMVTEAQAQRSPIQSFTERFEHFFVHGVLALVGLLLLAWVVVDEPFAASFYRVMAVLVAASPCALAISLPSAVLSGIARAARRGVLIKGGGALENLGSLRSIAFDKTGTLTEGKPRLTNVVVESGALEQELLAVALAVEEGSDHPLAGAVVTGVRERLGLAASGLSVTALESITGAA